MQDKSCRAGPAVSVSSSKGRRGARAEEKSEIPENVDFRIGAGAIRRLIMFLWYLEKIGRVGILFFILGTYFFINQILKRGNPQNNYDRKCKGFH